MNILFVNNFRGRGGGEEFLRDLLPGLVQKGVKVGLICRPGAPLEEMFRGSEISVYPIERSGKGFFSSVFQIASIIRRNGYEILSIQRGHDIIQSIIASLLSLRKTILIYTVQVPEFIKSRFLLSRMNRITTISRYISQKIISYNPLLAGRITILYYGIDLGKFKPGTLKPGSIRSRFGIAPHTPLIGTVGDLWKNQIEFLDALAEIRKQYPETRYALVASEGSMGQVRIFEDQAARLGLTDAILWTGRLSKEDMLSFYADIDIAVSTHRNEGFGIWILEALAMGKPVVSYNSGGIKDSLENCPAGVLIDGGPREMASAVVKILQDNVQRKKMSIAGPQCVAEKFSRERMIEDYYHFFNTVISGDPSSRLINSRNLGKSEKSTRPLNILQMISKNDRYGAQRIFLDQVKILHDMGNTVFVIGRGTEGYVPDSVRAMGVPYHGIAMKGIKDLFFLRKFVKKYRIDVIHTTLDRADYLGVLLSWLTGIPVVSTCMVPRFHIGFHFVKNIIVLSEKQKKLLQARGIRESKISLIRPGIDIDRFSTPDVSKRDTWMKKLRTDSYNIILCHIASIIPRKAQTVSIELASECKKRGERPLLIIIGDPLHGEYYESLLEQIRDLGLKENVYFTGWTSELPEILSLSHFTILPSENEALGVVLMEGMAAGTPIIAREGEGGAELVEEYGTGFLYSPEKGISFLGRSLLDTQRDNVRYQSIKDKCKNVGVNEFSLKRFGERLIQIYKFVHTIT